MIRASILCWTKLHNWHCPRGSCNESDASRLHEPRWPGTAAIFSAWLGRRQSGCKRPERVLVGHPFNPPHIIPLVEVVGGAKTSPEAIEQAMRFYASIGKKPIHLRKELPGHVANRLQAALYREILHLIEQDVLSVEETD